LIRLANFHTITRSLLSFIYIHTHTDTDTDTDTDIDTDTDTDTDTDLLNSILCNAHIAHASICSAELLHVQYFTTHLSPSRI